MKFIFSKLFIYPVFIISFLSLFSIATRYLISEKGNLRFLEHEDGLEEICKINDDLYNYYYKNEDYKVIDKDFGELNDNSQIILDFINSDYNTEYIFKYIWHTGKYIFFFFLLIIIILLTIYYSFASCIRCCTEKCCDFFSFSCCKNKRFIKISCILIPFIYFIVFIFALFAITAAVMAVKKFSGTVCVGLQLVDSFIEGETRDITPKWDGIFVVSDVLKQMANITSKNNQQLVNNIYNNRINYNTKSDEWKDYMKKSYEKNKENGNCKYMTVLNPKMSLTDEEKNINISPFYSYSWGPYTKHETILYEINKEKSINERITNVFSIFDNYLYSFLGCELKGDKMICEENSKISKLLTSGANIIEKLKDPLDNLKSKITKPAQNIYNQVNSTIIAIFSVIIIFVILYCIIIEALLSCFCCAKKCKCFGGFIKWIFCFIYYTSIFIVIIGFVIGIVIGFIGSLIMNLTQVIQFITSSENLNAKDPMIFGQNDYTKYLDVCLNGDGDLAGALNLTENFEQLNNINNISDDAEDLKNDTGIVSSPLISEYIEFFNNLNQNYLNIKYYDIDDKSEIIILDKLKEINNYVSGEYYSETKETCSFNENWNIKTKEEGYDYDPNYPPAETNKHYLIYLYDENVYKKANLETRYDKACRTEGHPYITVSDASKKFGKLFNDIGTNILSDKFSKEFLDDLIELNKIYGEKNKYINTALISTTGIIEVIINSFKQYISGNDSMFSLLNCRFVGENKLMLMDILYTSLGLYLDLLGTFTILFSLFIFIGIIFILIILKNAQTNEKEGVSDMNLETLNHIWKEKDINTLSDSEFNDSGLTSGKDI